DQPVPFLEGVHNIPFAEYSDRDNLAAIWANINIMNNQQNYNNFMMVEGDHINAIQGNLDNLTNVEDYLAAIYDDSIDVERLAAIYDDPMGVDHEMRF
ncbi:25535_t:CDS:2, partial [Gigaspora rosea]